MNKPKLQTIEYYDFSEVMDYLEEKYKFKHRDYLNKFENSSILLNQIIEELGGDIKDLEENLVNADNNDPEVIRKLDFRKKVYALRRDREPEWVRTIIGYILKEFGNIPLRTEW